MANLVQLATNGDKAYLDAVEDAFGGDFDFAQLVKLYGSLDGTMNERTYNLAEYTEQIKKAVTGNPRRKLFYFFCRMSKPDNENFNFAKRKLMTQK